MVEEIQLGMLEWLQNGFVDGEQVDCVEVFLCMIGLISYFVLLVLMFGYGLSSLNNLYCLVYDCGVCFGWYGGLNVWVFVVMVNCLLVCEVLC